MKFPRYSKLPIIEIISESFFRTKNNLRLFLYPLSTVSILILAYEFLVPYLFDEDSNFYIAISVFIYFLLFAIFAITCHRIVIIGFDAVPKFGFFKISVRELKYLAYVGIAYIIVFGAFRVISWFSRLLFELGLNSISQFSLYPIGIVICSYFISRLSLVLPSVAVGNSLSPLGSYHLTKGNGWRLFFIVMILPIVFGFLVAWVPEGMVILEIIVSIFWLFLYIVEVSALSLSYVYLNDSNNVLQNDQSKI